MSLIVKIILLETAFALSAPAADKTQYFVNLNSTLQLINGISSDHQKLLKYFNGTAIVAFFRISFAQSASVFSNNLALYLKDLKSFASFESVLHLLKTSIKFLLFQNNLNYILLDCTLA